MKSLQTIIDNDTLGSPITSMSFTKDSINLAFASKNGFFKIYNIKIGEFTLNNKLNNDYVISILFNKNNSNLTIVTKNGDIITYSSPSYQNIIFKLQLGIKVNIAKYSPLLNNTIGISTEDGSCKIIDLDKKEIIANFYNYHNGSMTCMAFSPVNKVFISTCGLDGKIHFFDISKKSLIKTINTNLPLTSITFNDIGIAVICSDANGNCFLYDLKNSRNSEKPKFKLKGNKGKINYIELKKKNKKNENIKVSNPESSNNKNPIINDDNLNSNLNNNNINANNMNSLKEISTSKIPLNEIYENKKPIKNISLRNKMNSNIQSINNSLQNSIQSYKNIDEQKEIKKVLENKITNILNQKKPEIYLNKNNINLNDNNMNQNQEIDPNIQNFIRNCVQEESNKLKLFIHEEINILHVDLIKQFEIQQNQMMQTIRNFSLMNSKMAVEIEKLKRENDNLKSQYF